MALLKIENIIKITKNSHLHKTTDCTYNVFTKDDKKYIQFDTYGSTDRRTTPKPSQTIQFDKSTADFIIGILKKEFDI